jgi:hypothetical protein
VPEAGAPPVFFPIGVVVRMHVDHRIARLLDARFGDFEDRARLVDGRGGLVCERIKRWLEPMAAAAAVQAGGSRTTEVTKL